MIRQAVVIGDGHFAVETGCELVTILSNGSRIRANACCYNVENVFLHLGITVFRGTPEADLISSQLDLCELCGDDSKLIAITERLFLSRVLMASLRAEVAALVSTSELTYTEIGKREKALEIRKVLGLTD